MFSSHPKPTPTAVLTLPHSISNDRHDTHDPTSIPKQRQRRRSLRRTHLEEASAGISPLPRIKFAHRQASEDDFTHDFEDTPDTEPQPISEHPSPEAGKSSSYPSRIDQHTASAILYTLEEALRHPNLFTPDYIEEKASMSDLLGGAASSANNGARPAASGSPHIRGPRDIMRDRQAREARKASEASEQKARAAEQKRNEEELMRQAERRAAAGAATQRLEERGEGQQRISGNSQRADRRAGDRTTSGGESIRPLEQPVQRRNTTARAPRGPEVAPLRLSMQSQSKPVETGVPGQPGLSSGAGPAQPAPLTLPSREGPTRSSFPHAFERWETLSAHWEGLTSFWLRRLEENSSEINRDPLSQQLSRQNTDLSAAGANLFHAVVELQRLRASSERKFQRWFFETREQEERATENLAVMAKQLEDERNSRSQAIQDAIEAERRKDHSDKVIFELKRELDIARNEARRAWDELGRREMEERERTISLRGGQPTVLGGVQVVPMVQGVPSRHGSTAARDLPPTRQGGPSDSGSGSTQPGGRFTDPESPSGAEAYQQYHRSQRPEPSDPFIESVRQQRRATATTSAPSSSTGAQYTQAPAVQPASPGTYYQNPESRPTLPSTQARQGEGQYDTSNSDDEYEIDEHGQYVLDADGNRIRYSNVSDSDTAEYEHSPRQHRQGRAPVTGPPIPMSGVEYRQGPTTSTAGNPPSAPASSVDYSGSGYGAAGAGVGWESFPRHHHPTRLSDVLEEDERSRTSASQVSRRE